MKKTLIVNLYGGPGAGKSTGAAYIFSKLKSAGVNAELIGEYAKDKVWEENFLPLTCQEYILGKQSYRIRRVLDKVDVVITDSPVLLSAYYNKEETIQKPLEDLALGLFFDYPKMEYFVRRSKPYNPKGRTQTEDESNFVATDIEEFLIDLSLPLNYIHGEEVYYDLVVESVLDALKRQEEN